MRKFLLSSFALLMSVAMMAVGAGDGTNKANAIDFDWTSGNIHEASGALWYCVDLAPIDAAAEPALVLYLTNLSDEEAAVDVQISLAGSQRTVSYNIAAEGYYRMDLPIAQFREFITVDQVNLALQSNQKIALSAKVYEFPEYVKEAVANSEPIDWNSGVKQDALSTKWYEVDITSLKTEKQHLQVGFINHEASKKALLTATFVLRGENITLPLVVPAGFSTTKVIDYQLLAKLPVNRIHVGVTTDSPIEVVTSTRSAIADDPTPCLNAINAEHGVTYVHEAGDTQWYKISLDLLKSTDAFSSFYLANKGNQRANVTIGMVPDCQYTTGTKITLPIPAGFELGALAPNILGNLIEELTRFESAYNKVDAKDVYLEIKTDQPIHFGLDVTNAATNPCLREDLVTFDWATGAKIEAGKATWFDMELDAVRNLGSHINFTFTNHADSIVWVATVVSVDCPAKVTMPLLVPVPAHASVDQLVDYSILDAINIDNIYVGVKADGPVELKATAVNAEVIPSAGCESATLLGSGEYTQNPGTKWYQLPMSLFDEVGAAAKLSFKNLTGTTATLSAGVTVGCEYAIAHRAKVKVPKSIDLSVNVPKRILNFARQFVDNDVENFYLQLTTDKAIKFSIDLQAPDVDACRDAIEFDWAAWEKDGLQLEANQDKWYKVNLDYLFNKLENGEDLVVNLVNGSEDMDVHVLASVSPTCPALLSVEKTVDIPAGSDLYKVFTYEEVMKYVGQYDKYIYDGELEMLLGQLATYKVYNKMVELLKRTPFAKFIPFGQVDLLLEAYGDHLTIAGIKDIVNNYEKYLSVAQLKEVLKTQKEYVSLQDAITLIEKYGDYIPYVDAEKILNNYEKYLPAAGGVASILKKCEKYITHENLQKVVDRCKQYLPIEEMKVLINRLKQYLPENNSCYVNIKTTGELIVKPDDPEPPTPEEPCCPEECEDVPVLDWSKTIQLSQLVKDQLYKLDITGLYTADAIQFVVNNDLGNKAVVASEIYKDCRDDAPVAEHQNTLKVNRNRINVAHDKFAALVDEKQCCMFVKFTAIDTIPVTPDTPCDEAIYTYNIALCEGQAYEWSVNGQTYTENAQDSVVQTDANGCKTTHNLTVTVAAAQTDTIEICEDELPYEYEEVNGTTHSLETFGLHKVVLTNGCWMYVDLKDKNCPVTTCEDVVTDTIICVGDTFVWSVNGKEYKYTETTDVEVPAQTTDGCEFNYVLRLTVINGDAQKFEYAQICEGESYPWRGQTCREEKTYTDTENVECGKITYNLVLSYKDDCDTPDDPCANIPELNWRDGVKLSELQAGWYKMNIAGVHANQESVTANVINDLGCEATVTLAGYAHCEDAVEDALYNISATVAVGDTSKVVSYDVFQGVVAPHVEVIYVNIESIVKNCDIDDPCANVQDSITNVEICEGETYVWEVNGKTYGALGAATEARTAFNADADHGTASTTAGAYQVSKDGITLDVTQGRLQNAEGGHYRIYANNTLTITSTVGKITKVEFTCTANNTNQYGPGCFSVADGTYSYNDKVGVWTGSADEVVFTANRQVRATDIVVTYGGGAATSGTDEVVKPNEDGCDVKYILNWKVIECPTPEDPCADAELISWKDVVNIPATSGKWYKIDVRTAVESGKDIKFTVINGDEPNKVNVKFNTECFIVPDEPVDEPTDEPVEPANTITVRAKVPDYWTDQIYVWVWPDGGEGVEYVAEKDGDWWSYTHEGEYVNIIFKNGTSWTGYDYQTTDMRFTSDACVQLGGYAWDSKISYVEVPCDSRAKVAPYEIADEYNEFNSVFAANETKSTIITTELIEAFNIKDYVYAYVTTTGSATAYAELVEDEPIIPGDDCEHATLLNWRNGVRLSQLSAGWYKLYVGDVHANQESVTAKVINDLTCKATVTAYSYAHCESDEALSSDVAKTFKLGESVKTVSYADFSDVVAPHLEYVYVNVISIVEDCEPIIPGDDCEHATLLDWRNGVRLSQLSAGWYKLYVGDVHANQESVTAKVINDLTCKATVTAYSYAHCESDEALSSDVAKTFKLGESVKTVSYADFSDVVAPHLEYVYVNVISIVEDCEPIEPGDDCEHATLLDWRNGVRLSQLSAGWYKLYVGDVHANQESVTAKVINDLTCKATVTAYSYAHCESDEALSSDVAKTFKLGESVKTVSYAEFSDVVAPHLEYVYVNVISIVEDCEPIEPGEDCEHAILLDWSDVKLSQLVEGNWYKLDFFEVQANQSSATFKATNDLNGDARVSAAAYYHCEDTEAMTSATKQLVQGHVGEREVSYKELTDVIGHADVLYVQVTDITVAGEDCEHAIALDWSDVKLSQLVEGNWYKLDFSEVQANQSSATFKATNDLNGDARVSAAAYYHCEDTEAMTSATKQLVQGHVGEREVSYKELTDVIGHADVLYVQVTDITVTPEPVEKDTVVNNVTEFVCDGEEYVDALGEKHIVSSLIDPTLLTWTTTIETETTVTVYNYVITPIVAPEVMTAELLATIGAMPVLVAGEKVNVAGTVEAIKNHYAAQDTEAIADVESVVWTAGADATLACDAETHTMILTVTSGCEFEWSAELTLDVTPIDVKETTVPATICEGQTYPWGDGEVSVAGSYPLEVENEAGCVVEIKTLVLTVTPADTVELTETACDSYEWHGEVYTETGDYTYEEECYIEILHLTVTPADTVELTETACDSYEWHGEVYTETGDYTYEEECYKEILHLTINETEVVELTETACESYEWHGETYTESGDYTYEAECYKEILHLTINTVVTEDVTASDCYAYEWNGVTYTKSGNYTFNTTSVVTGCDSIVTLHLTITAETPEENPALGEAVAVAKYGNRMIVLHLNGFAEKYGWTPAAGQVAWYQVVGEMDNSWEIVDDKPLGVGLYIEDEENLQAYTGEIYAIIDSSNEGACGNLYRSKVLVLAPAGQAPKLMPTIARPSEDLHLLNLNSANVAEVRVYNTSGELMSVYKAEEASEFVFKAETMPGYYLVEVQHNGEQTTLRYIVK